MAFEMECNMCGVAIHLDESRTRSMINCPSCGQVIFVQQSETPAIPPMAIDDSLRTADFSTPLGEAKLPDRVPLADDSQDLKPLPLPPDELDSDTSSSLIDLVSNEESPAVLPVTTPPGKRGAGSGEYEIADPDPQSKAESTRRDPEPRDNPDPAHTRAAPFGPEHRSAAGDYWIDTIEAKPSLIAASKPAPGRLSFATLAAAYMCGVVSGLIIAKLLFR